VILTKVGGDLSGPMIHRLEPMACWARGTPVEEFLVRVHILLVGITGGKGVTAF